MLWGPVTQRVESLENDPGKLLEFQIHILDISKFRKEDIFNIVLQLEINFEKNTQALEFSNKFLNQSRWGDFSINSILVFGGYKHNLLLLNNLFNFLRDFDNRREVN